MIQLPAAEFQRMKAELVTLHDALRWRRFSEEPSPLGVSVIVRLSQRGTLPMTAHFDGECWQSDNWHQAIDAGAEDLWLPVPEVQR